MLKKFFDKLRKARKEYAHILKWNGYAGHHVGRKWIYYEIIEKNRDPLKGVVLLQKESLMRNIEAVTRMDIAHRLFPVVTRVISSAGVASGSAYIHTCVNKGTLTTEMRTIRPQMGMDVINAEMSMLVLS